MIFFNKLILDINIDFLMIKNHIWCFINEFLISIFFIYDTIIIKRSFYQLFIQYLYLNIFITNNVFFCKLFKLKSFNS